MSAESRRSGRRDFLKTLTAATVAAPYVITSNALGATGVAPASDRITTALIGSGGRGQQIIAGGDQVVAVCDVDAKHAERTKQKIDAASDTMGCMIYSDFRGVLARDDIDAVVVATPDHWHTLIAAAAIKAGKAVYVEKPLSLTIREGRILADIAQRYGAIVQVGSQQRSDVKFHRACELVRNGRIGELKTVRVEIPTRPGDGNKPWTPQAVPPELDYDTWLGPAPLAPYHPDRCHYKFRFVTDYSGGDVTNWGAHQLDIAQWGIGADDSGPVEVEGHGKRNQDGLHDVFYDIHVDFTYASGVKIELRSGGNGVTFVGTEGSIFVSRSKLEADPASILTSRIGPDEIHLARGGPENEGGTHMGIWLDCIRARNSKALNVPVETGHRSATVCHLANIIMGLDRKVQWDPAAEQFVDDDEANHMTWRPMRAPWTF
ncbi:MAG: Gfo/Idh/MocA family oxidoreductase [Planctomycetes bacterium]|nr:Gfo/Idh/MocA family oxidoreductase [Planctomycetota bacterium]MBL7037538.1 Gfo/Idh/MocA family oxidoreductase [Pirellulaceae bacterium]